MVGMAAQAFATSNAVMSTSTSPICFCLLSSFLALTVLLWPWPACPITISETRWGPPACDWWAALLVFSARPLACVCDRSPPHAAKQDKKEWGGGALRASERLSGSLLLFEALLALVSQSAGGVRKGSVRKTGFVKKRADMSTRFWCVDRCSSPLQAGHAVVAIPLFLAPCRSVPKGHLLLRASPSDSFVWRDYNPLRNAASPSCARNR